MASNLMDDDLEDLKPMEVTTLRDDPRSSHESTEIIPTKTVEHLYSFFFTTHGFIIGIILVWLVLILQYSAGYSGYLISSTGNRLYQNNAVINTYKPENLRELIRETSHKAIAAKALQTIPITRRKYIDDEGLEFVISTSDATKDIIRKDRVSNFDKSVYSGSRSGAIPIVDHLDVKKMDNNLVVFDYESVFGLSYSIVLNKFNTIKDHCLLITNEFLPQIAPLNGMDLSVWYSALDAISGVGFYNSNLLAGASQAHKHMQFIPLDRTWKERGPDASYGTPLDDKIMPKIESKKWKPFHCAYTPGAHNKRVSSKHFTKSRYIYQLRQFDFQHAVAVLRVSGEFKTVQEHSDYLQCVYERLLEATGISIDTLNTCASPDEDDEDEDDMNHGRARALQTEAADSMGSIAEQTLRQLKAVPLESAGVNISAFTALRNRVAYGQKPASRQHTLSADTTGTATSTGTDASDPTFEGTLPRASKRRGGNAGGGGGDRGILNSAIRHTAQAKARNAHKARSGGGDSGGGGERDGTTERQGRELDAVSRNRLRHRQLSTESSSTATVAGTDSRTDSESTTRRATATEAAASAADVVSTPRPDCLRDGAYNLILTTSYMMVVPRSQKGFAEGLVDINSFGYLGFMMASTEDGLNVIQAETPLGILKEVSKHLVK